MSFKEFLTTIFKSFSPNSCKYLAREKKLADAFIYFFGVLFLTLLITTVLFTPKILNYPKLVDEKISKFNNLTITFNGEMNAPLTLSTNPLIVVDTKKSNLTNEVILVSQDKTYFKWLFIKKESNMSYTNLLDSPEKIKKLVVTLTILMAPVLWFALYIFIAIKYLFIILMAILIVSILLKIFKRQMKFINLMKAGLYSSTLMILLELVSLPFIKLSYIPLLIFAVLFAAAAWLVSEKESDKRDRFEIKPRERDNARNNLKSSQKQNPKREHDVGFEKY